MKTLFRALAGLALLAALVVPAAQPSRKATEADLREVNERIERVQRQLQTNVVEKDRLSKALRDAERLVSQARGDLSGLRARRAERLSVRMQLLAEKVQRESDRDATQADLARQLRAAYMMGRNEPMKLLLNQRDPAEFGRNLTYYGYLGRLRAGQVRSINENITKIDQLTAKIDAEDAELASLEQQQKQKVGELESARRQRGKVLASLEQESRNKATQLARLQKQRAQFEQLLKDLERATEAAPYYPNSPFAQLRGKLAWPVAGRIAVNYGANSASGLRSDGIDIDAEPGTTVRAVHDGIVVHADWLAARGLLIILDHGNGYWSVYGNNENLFKAKGSKVSAGEKIATVGDSGGRRRPGLYFEIRRNGKALDPRGWFRSRAPPAG